MATESPATVLVAVGANAAIAVAKGTAAAMTGSASMLAEAVHSLVDAGNGCLLLVGLRRASLPPDANHPFGHGKELYFWTFVVAVVIFGLGGGVTIIEGIDHLRHPVAPQDVLVAYIVLGVAFAFESISFVVAIRALRREEPGGSVLRAIVRSKDPAIFAVVLEDFAALCGLVIAFAGTIASEVSSDGRYDGAASIAIGVLLIGVALVLIWQVQGLLIGESADPGVVRCIERIAIAQPSVASVRRTLTMHLGPEDILVAIDLVFHADASLGDVAATIDRIQEGVKREQTAVREIFVEVDALMRRPLRA